MFLYVVQLALVATMPAGPGWGDLLKMLRAEHWPLGGQVLFARVEEHAMMQQIAVSRSSGVRSGSGR